MHDQAITSDFHNTLAACPEWFDLEVRRLPSSFLAWWAAETSRSFSDEARDEADARYRQLRRDINEHGNELTAEACLAAVFADMNIAVPRVDLAAGVEYIMRLTLSGTTPIPGAIETVLALQDAGMLIGVISSAVYHPFLEWTLESFGIRDAMRTVITSASAGYYKSRPELYLHAAAQLGAPPARIVHVGDSLRFDVGGASRVGMGTVWLQHDANANAEHSFVPDLTLRTLEGSAGDILGLLASRIVSGAHGPTRVRT
jgi:HAD superfamily hydrolase (TIGR01509 family)